MNQEDIVVKGIDEIPLFSWDAKTKEFFVLNNKFDGVNSLQDFIGFLNNLQKENKQLKGSLQTYEILLKANIEENQQLKEQLQQKEDIINKAKEFAKGHIFQFDGDKDFDALLEILDNKGE